MSDDPVTAPRCSWSGEAYGGLRVDAPDPSSDGAPSGPTAIPKSDR